MKKKVSILLALICMILSGCSGFNTLQPTDSHQPMPTIHQLFSNEMNIETSAVIERTKASGAPTVASVFGQFKPAPLVTRAYVTPVGKESLSNTLTVESAGSSLTLTALPAKDPYQDIPVYDDQLSLDWSIQPLVGMAVNFSDTSHAHSGKHAIAITPLHDFENFYLTVNPNAKQIYSRDQIVGLSFWLNSGSETLNIGDLAVSVIGSNAYPYWVSGDDSVFKDSQYTFSETKLYDLQINHPIPPETWVEVIIYPDKLIYDPAYQYITGFYIKNNEGILRTFYVDDISLIKIDTPITSTTIIPTRTLTPTLELKSPPSTGIASTLSVTPTLTASLTLTPSPMPSHTPTATPTYTLTPTKTPTLTFTPTPTSTQTQTRTNTPTPTRTPLPTNTSIVK
jgi:hypothetical protein